MQFKDDYTRQEVEIKGVSFSIKKINAFKGAILFTDLVSRLKNVDIDTVGSDSSKVTASLIKTLISALDSEYIEKNLMPKIFDNIAFSVDNMSGVKNVKLSSAGTILDSKLDAFDILELLVRGLCVNFLESGLERLSKLQVRN